MATMPRGQPRTVPDPAGELYDQEMAKVRAQRQAEDRALLPHVRRPSTLESFIPVLGPAWEAAADFQEGDIAGGTFNAAMAAADLLPAAIAIKGARAAAKGIGMYKKGAVTADAARKQLRRRGLAGPDQEIHHTRALDGTGRNVEDPRNHYMYLKVLPTEQHRRLTGSWNNKPKYGAVQAVWYGTTDWMKALPTSAVAEFVDGVQNGFTSSRDGAARQERR